MDANNSMCGLRERKQQAFDAACCDFVVNHDVEAIARKLRTKTAQCFATC